MRDPLVDLRTEPATGSRAELPLTCMAQAAAANHESGIDLDGYRDYRGVTVVGAWLWDAELEIGLATEQDRDEAYAVTNRTLRAMRGADAVIEFGRSAAGASLPGEGITIFFTFAPVPPEANR